MSVRGCKRTGPGSPPGRSGGRTSRERQWGTVREDYSRDGDAWDYFPHDHARRRAYRWGEDGLAGICDDQQRLCFALALWNGRDPILKERLFGLTNGEGNHGEDVKELYYYLDATPTHSYLKMLYKYPQARVPLRPRWSRRTAAAAATTPEYELLDTGVFDDDRYFDVFVEYAKAGADDMLMRVTVAQPRPRAGAAAPAAARSGSATPGPGATAQAAPAAARRRRRRRSPSTQPDAGRLPPVTVDGAPTLLFTDNETNAAALFGVPIAGRLLQGRLPRLRRPRRPRRGQPGADRDQGRRAAIALDGRRPAATCVVRAAARPTRPTTPPFADFDAIFAQRIAEADEFYADLQPGSTDPDARRVQRQAFAGMIWTQAVLPLRRRRSGCDGDPAQPPPPAERRARPQRATGGT